MTIPSSVDFPVNVSAGRGRGTIYIDPYNGEVISSSNEGIRKFFSDVRRWHRWFNLQNHALNLYEPYQAIL